MNYLSQLFIDIYMKNPKMLMDMMMMGNCLMSNIYIIMRITDLCLLLLVDQQLYHQLLINRC